jgi:hypothetical protein
MERKKVKNGKQMKKKLPSALVMRLQAVLVAGLSLRFHIKEITTVIAD